MTVEEIDWLPHNFLKGDIVYEYNGYTYGVISYDGIAVSETYGETPFFEVPLDTIKPFIDEKCIFFFSHAYRR